MLSVLDAEPLLRNTCDGYAPRPDYRPQTKFETRGIKLGHSVFDLIFTRAEPLPCHARYTDAQSPASPSPIIREESAMYPEIEPNQQGFLNTEAGHPVSWELCRNPARSEEHTSALQSLMCLPYPVQCL